MSYIIKGRTCDYEVVIGLEVHCQVISKAKLFSLGLGLMLKLIKNLFLPEKTIFMQIYHRVTK